MCMGAGLVMLWMEVRRSRSEVAELKRLVFSEHRAELREMKGHSKDCRVQLDALEACTNRALTDLGGGHAVLSEA